MPSLSMTPGRKFSITTSAVPMSLRAVSLSDSFSKSRTMPRLLRFHVALAGVFQRGPPGGSIRMTSAPWSPSSIAAMGPAMYCPKSITRTPSSTGLTAMPYSVRSFHSYGRGLDYFAQARHLGVDRCSEFLRRAADDFRSVPEQHVPDFLPAQSPHGFAVQERNEPGRRSNRDE